MLNHATLTNKKTCLLLVMLIIGVQVDKKWKFCWRFSLPCCSCTGCVEERYWFRIMPASNQRSEGEKVLSYIITYLYSLFLCVCLYFAVLFIMTYKLLCMTLDEMMLL